MGSFFAVSAVKTKDPHAVKDFVQKYCDKYKVPTSLKDLKEEMNIKTDATLYDYGKGWVYILWPSYFNIHDVALAKDMSSEIGVLVSTINVYDGDFWCHHLFEAGVHLDKFCSVPDYFSESEEEAKSDKEKWNSNPSTVADKFNVPTDSISKYLVHIDYEDDTDEEFAYKGDEFELYDLWVFTDFWEKLGLTYPEDEKKIVYVLSLDEGFMGLLPTLEDD